MKGKIRWKVFVCILSCLGILAGCSKGKEPFIYYVNAEGTSLVREAYEPREGTIDEMIRDILQAMKEETDSIDYKSVFPKKVQVKNKKQ